MGLHLLLSSSGARGAGEGEGVASLLAHALGDLAHCLTAAGDDIDEGAGGAAERQRPTCPLPVVPQSPPYDHHSLN